MRGEYNDALEVVQLFVCNLTTDSHRYPYRFSGMSVITPWKAVALHRLATLAAVGRLTGQHDTVVVINHRDRA